MTLFAFRTLREPSYWSSWTLSVCLHTMMVGVALLLSDQLPTPQQPERDPIAVSFVTPEPTHTVPTHLQTLQKSPPTPTTKAKLAQPEAIPRKPTRSKKPRRQIQNRQTVVPQRIVHPTFIAPQPMPQLTNVTQTPVDQPTTFRNIQTAYQPTVKNGTVSSQAVTRAVGKSDPQALPEHTGSTQQLKIAKVHSSPSQKKSFHVSPTAETFDPITPRNPVIRNHVANAPQLIATAVRSAPRRQSVNSLPSHEEKRIRAQAMEVMKLQVARGKSHAPVKHVFSKPVRQSASLSSGSPVVRTRSTMSYTRQRKKSRPATNARTATRDGFSPELLAFSKLLREKIARTLVFPRLAKRLGYSGTTHVALALSKTGIVRDLKVSQPSGYDILDKAAIATLKKVLQTTKPPESIAIEQLVIPIAFNLKRN